MQEQCSKDASKESTLYFHNEYDLQKQAEKETFDRGLEKAREYGTRWTRVKAFGRELKANIQEILDDRQENRADKSDNHDFYQNTSTEKSETPEYGASKLEDPIYGLNLSKEALKELDQYKQIEQERVLRQGIMQEKLAAYQEHCQSEGLEPIKNIENIFTPENERAIVVLCTSQEAAAEANKNCKQEGFVFLALDSQDAASEEVLDLSALEDRKLLVCGSEMERLDTLEQIENQNSLHVQTTDYDFSAANEFEFEDW